MKYKIVSVDEDGDLKPLYYIHLNHSPVIGESLTYMNLDTLTRCKLQVVDIVYPIESSILVDGDDNNLPYVKQIKNVAPLLVVENLYTDGITP